MTRARRVPDFVHGLGFQDPELPRVREANRARMGVGSLGGISDFTDALGGLPSSLIRRATFRSNLTPAFSWDPSAPPTPVAASDGSSATSASSLVRLAQPALDLELANGQRITIAPEGDPSGDWRVVVGGVVVAVVGSFALALLIGFLIGRRSGRRR